MRHPALDRKLHDMEYERRRNRAFLPHALMLLPLLTLTAMCIIHFGGLPLSIIAATLLTYSGTVFVTDSLCRRQILEDMRREGLVDARYSPPEF